MFYHLPFQLDRVDFYKSGIYSCEMRASGRRTYAVHYSVCVIGKLMIHKGELLSLNYEHAACFIKVKTNCAILYHRPLQVSRDYSILKARVNRDISFFVEEFSGT